MVSLRDQMRKVSSRALNKFKPIENPRLVSGRPVGGLQLPKDPRLVRRDIHDDAPSYLPSPTASHEEVQYFIYAVLTTKVFGCAKACPQWVLETCWNCEKTGEEFLALTSEETMTLCPMTSKLYAFADADQKRWSIEKMPSPYARELIGKAILAVLRDRKNRSTQKDQIQRHWDAERFRHRLNHESNNSLYPNTTFPGDWAGAGESSTCAARVDYPWYSRVSSYTSGQNRGSGNSSAYTKSTAATTPSVSEGSSAGHHEQDVASRNFPENSSSAPTLSNIRRTGSLRVRGSAPVLRATEPFRPATMRNLPHHCSQLLGIESTASMSLESEHMGLAPSLRVEIPNGHMSMDFGLPLLPARTPGTNEASLSSHAKTHRGSCSTYSPSSPCGSPRLQLPLLPQQQMPSPAQGPLATHRAWPPQNSLQVRPVQSLESIPPSNSIKNGHNQILGTQYSSGTPSQHPYFGVAPLQNAQHPTVGTTSSVSNFSTTATRQWPPHQLVFSSDSQSAFPSINSAEYRRP
ncbi:hypothetical protein J1614_011684 [Plenodomus biglobosus]|nr:hypothetical protein J1614_011684 [Plenodomus biglobosus]